MRIVVTLSASAASVAALKSAAPTPPPAPCPSTSVATGASGSLAWARAGPCGVSTSIIVCGHLMPPALELVADRDAGVAEPRDLGLQPRAAVVDGPGVQLGQAEAAAL